MMEGRKEGRKEGRGEGGKEGRKIVIWQSIGPTYNYNTCIMVFTIQ